MFIHKLDQKINWSCQNTNLTWMLHENVFAQSCPCGCATGQELQFFLSSLFKAFESWFHVSFSPVGCQGRWVNPPQHYSWLYWFGLLWFGLVCYGLVWLVYLCLEFIHRKKSIVKTPTQPQLNFSWVLHENGSAQSYSCGCATGQELQFFLSSLSKAFESWFHVSFSPVCRL